MPKLWPPPNTWFHGSQSTRTGGVLTKQGRHSTIICWLLHHIRWVVMTPLGLPVEPEVNRIFATVAGPVRSNASSTAAVGEAASSSANETGVQPWRRPLEAALSAGPAPAVISSASRGTAASIALP